MRIEAASRLRAARSQDWYSRLTPEQRTKYLKKYPGTKFHDTTALVVPAKMTTLTAALVEAGFVSSIKALPNLGAKAKAGLIHELKDQVHHVADNLGTTKGAVVTAFKEPKVSNILEACGYSFATVFHAMHLGHKLAEQGALHVFAHFAEHTALHKAAHHGAHKVKAVDKFIDKYPVLKKVSGPALAGLMLYGYTLTEPHKLGDWNMENIKKAFTGDFGVADFMQTPEALYLGTHVATGKAISLTAFVESAGTLALGLTCTAIMQSKNPKLQKLAGKIQGVASKFKPKKSVLTDLAESKEFKGQDVVKQITQDSPKNNAKPGADVQAPKGPADRLKDTDPKRKPNAKPEDEAAEDKKGSNGDGDWWESKSDEAKQAYLQEHPNSVHNK